jgi:acyl-CoA reductase-like NAD-dependent aldehyde dehydrogenase
MQVNPFSPLMRGERRYLAYQDGGSWMNGESAVTLELFINNKDVASGSYFEVRDPGRFDAVVAQLAVGNAGHVHEAVTAAHAAYGSWKNSSVQQRIASLNAAAAQLESRSVQLAKTLVQEQGMLLRDTERDVGNGIRTLRESAALLESYFDVEEYEDEEGWVRLEKVPRGVVAAIVPWNAPIGLTMAKVGPALATGNTVVVKPSPFAPVAVSQALRTMAACFPPGVINIVYGEGEVGAVLTHHPLVRKISFTGGTRTGRVVMAAAAESIKNIALELGGNDPAIILDDVRPSDVVPELIKGIFPRSGQVCYAIKRVYVPARIFDKFHDTFCDAVNALKVGYGLDPRSTLAPLNNANQYNFIRGLIDRTRQSGATVHELGHKLDPDNWANGYYVLPAVARDLSPSAELVVGEQFGPVIPLIPYETEEQVLDMANGTEYGLGSSIWSGDYERASRLASRVEAGMTFINSHARTKLGDRTMPFGGIKQSGIGRVRTRIGMDEYIEYHAINLNKKTIPRT